MCGCIQHNTKASLFQHLRPSPSQTLPNMISGRTEHGLCAHKQYIFALCGKFTNNYIGACEKYDLYKNKWSSIPSSQAPKSFVGSGVIRTVLYMVGGANRWGSINEIESFDLYFNSKNWKSVKIASIPMLAKHIYHPQIVRLTESIILIALNKECSFTVDIDNKITERFKFPNKMVDIPLWKMHIGRTMMDREMMVPIFDSFEHYNNEIYLATKKQILILGRKVKMIEWNK